MDSKLKNMITIIIPTYNNEQTIERAIRSVVMQTYVDWELIIINDKSTDKTLDICKHYAEMYQNIRVINNEENVGAGIARQIGLKDAKGEFITFLDSDDLLMADFLYQSMELQKQHDSDVVYTSYTILYPQGIQQVIPAGDFIMEGEATPQLHFVQEKKFLTGKIFRKSLLEKIPWSDKRVGEDVQTLFFATYMANKVRSSSYSGYVHCFREGSLLANAPYAMCFCGSTIAEQEIIDFLIEHNEERLWKYILTMCWYNYNLILQKLDEGKEITKKEMRKHNDMWKQVQVWFKTHKEYVKQIK